MKKSDIAIDTRLMIHHNRMTDLMETYGMSRDQASEQAYEEIVTGQWDKEINKIVRRRVEKQRQKKAKRKEIIIDLLTEKDNIDEVLEYGCF